MYQNSWNKTKLILREKEFIALNIFIIGLNIKINHPFYSSQKKYKQQNKLKESYGKELMNIKTKAINWEQEN